MHLQPPITKRVNTEVSIECPVCGVFIALSLTLNTTVTPPVTDGGSSRVFVGLLSTELYTYNVHQCWPKEDDDNA